MTRRLLLSALLAASLLVAFEAGRASASRSATSSIPAPATHVRAPDVRGIGEPDPSLPFPTPFPVRGPSATAASVPGKIRGVASTYGPGYDGLTASRWPRGTVLRICGPGGCVTRTTNDYGPSRRLFPERIVDLDVRTFEAVCGCSWRRGLVRVTVERL